MIYGCLGLAWLRLCVAVTLIRGLLLLLKALLMVHHWIVYCCVTKLCQWRIHHINRHIGRVVLITGRFSHERCRYVMWQRLSINISAHLTLREQLLTLLWLLWLRGIRRHMITHLFSDGRISSRIAFARASNSRVPCSDWCRGLPIRWKRSNAQVDSNLQTHQTNSFVNHCRMT